jgi:hypothetical protein
MGVNRNTDTTVAIKRAPKRTQEVAETPLKILIPTFNDNLIDPSNTGCPSIVSITPLF